jgi:hypothetical protein
MRRYAVLGSVFAGVAFFPAVAEASPNEFDEGAYLLVSPGILGVNLDGFGFGYQFAVGGGYMWSPGKIFKVAFGGTFEHYIPNPSIRGMNFRFLPEARLGGGIDRVWGYGLVGAGFTLLANPSAGGPDAYPGFDLEFGGGIQVLVVKRFFVGGEHDIDLQIFDGFLWPIMGFKAIAGLKF